MNNVLLNENGRLRSGWRAAGFFISFFILWTALFAFGKVLLAQMELDTGTATWVPILLPLVTGAVVSLALGALFGKYLDGVPFKALGMSFSRGWAIHFLIGCVIGGAALVTSVLIPVIAGRAQFRPDKEHTAGEIITSLSGTFLMFLIGAVWEESLFRGYLLQTFTRARVIAVGVLITSLFFALAHNSNPDAGWLSWTNTFIAGVWFAAAYLKTRDLWLPIGMHLTWNWLQGPFFGINVSGISDFSPVPVFNSIDAGPAWLTGGSYGIEGGVACTIALLIFIAVILMVPLPNGDAELLDLSSHENPA